jgi:hypothetical protein
MRISIEKVGEVESCCVEKCKSLKKYSNGGGEVFGMISDNFMSNRHESEAMHLFGGIQMPNFIAAIFRSLFWSL